MSRRMHVASLLNPEPPPPSTRDVLPLIQVLHRYARTHPALHVPTCLYSDLEQVVNSLGLSIPDQRELSPPPPQPPPPQQPRSSASAQLNLDITSSLASALLDSTAPPASAIEDNVQIDSRRILSRLYTYENINAYVEYPETNTVPTGYLFRRDPNHWSNPLEDFAYAAGAPMGQTILSKDVLHPCLNNVHKTPVPCYESHSSCQGIKFCPFTSISLEEYSHTQASREGVMQRMEMERDARIQRSTPLAEVFQQTAALVTAIRRQGCRAHQLEQPQRSELEQASFDRVSAHNTVLMRGFEDPVQRCQGSILLEYDKDGRALFCCEFYDKTQSRSHHISYIDESQYDVEYLEAVYFEDTDIIDEIEHTSAAEGYGPLAGCSTIVNASSKRLHCPHDHRGSDGQLRQQLLERKKCPVRFRVYEPKEDFRAQCPYIYIQMTGIHNHPPPLPNKVPPRIRALLFDIFGHIGEDLADLTPRRFLRHSILKAFLNKAYPDKSSPALSDLHSALANRARLGMYIRQAKKDVYPEGTGWPGVLHRYRIQNEQYPVEAHYIRKIIDVDDGKGERLRIIVCMTPEGSSRLRKARYLQCDVSHKRIVGYKEFVIGSKDRQVNLNTVYARLYINRETAEAHEQMFVEIDKLVEEDTGRGLHWRHLDCDSLTEYLLECCLQMIGDQGGGQGVGFGRYLWRKAQGEAYRNKYDLHQPHRLLSSLTVYEHLHRIYRICTVHWKRNIRESGFSEEVRAIMRSLISIHFPAEEWDRAIESIRVQGGQPGRNWVANKIQSGFVFEGICWEKSLIPLDIWRAGDSHDNMIENAHSDVNQEGRYCSLLGGLEAGERYDTMQLEAVKITETLGIRPSYATGHISENIARSLRRQDICRCNQFRAQDEKIRAHNERFNELEQKYRRCLDAWNIATAKRNDLQHPTPLQLTRAFNAVQKARDALDNAWNVLEACSRNVVNLPIGSGHTKAMTLQEFFGPLNR